MISLPCYVEISPTESDIFKIQPFDPHFIQYFVKSYSCGKRLSILSELYVFVLTVIGGESARKKWLSTRHSSPELEKYFLFLNNGIVLNRDIWKDQGNALYLACSFYNTD